MTTISLGAWILAAMTFLQPHGHHEALARATTVAIESEPALWVGDESKLKTAALVVAIEFRESSFRDVTSTTHDHCYMQLHDRADLVGHAEACVRAGIKMLRAALARCSGVQTYVGGRGGCHDERATRISNDRLAIAGRLLAEVN